MNKKKLIIGGLFVVAGYVLIKLYKGSGGQIKDKFTVAPNTPNRFGKKWEDLDEETVKEKAKEIRVGVNKTINANINNTKPTGDMLGLFPNGVNINWDRADFGNAFPNYG